MGSCGCAVVCESCRRGEAPPAVKDAWLRHLPKRQEAQAAHRPPADLALADEEGVFARWRYGFGEFTVSRSGPRQGHAYAWFEITTACDQVCRHCFLGERLRHGHVPFADVAMALEALPAFDVREVVLSGGEPTLHPRFADLVRLARRTLPRLRILTNGRRLPPALLDLLASPGVVVEVPLLAWGAAHDRLTGVPGSFGRAVATIRALRERGAAVVLTTTLTRFAAEDLPHLEAFARELGIPFAPSELFPVGRAREAWTELAPVPSGAVL